MLISADVLEQLLLAAVRGSSLNLFVESFLKVVQHLLESIEPRLQLVGTRLVSSCQIAYMYSYSSLDQEFRS